MGFYIRDSLFDIRYFPNTQYPIPNTQSPNLLFLPRRYFTEDTDP